MESSFYREEAPYQVKGEFASAQIVFSKNIGQIENVFRLPRQCSYYGVTLFTKYSVILRIIVNK